MHAHMKIRVCFAIVALAAAGIPSFAAPADDWTRFRGPKGAGISESSELPAELGREQNVIWKSECEPGLSSPIVIDNRLFYTSFQGDERFVHCLDASTGMKHWS